VKVIFTLWDQTKAWKIYSNPHINKYKQQFKLFNIFDFLLIIIIILHLKFTLVIILYFVPQIKYKIVQWVKNIRITNNYLIKPCKIPSAE
jgi:hypothetical protein